MFTLNDAIQEKRLLNAAFDASVNQRILNEKRIATILRDNPKIGVLIRKGKPVYYVCKTISYNNFEVIESTNPETLI
jgi:hypothetical protein